jgi:hypothetical protein
LQRAAAPGTFGVDGGGLVTTPEMQQLLGRGAGTELFK